MEIKEAVEFIKNSSAEIKDDDKKFAEANLTILNAIYNKGYTLCKVNEAVEKMQKLHDIYKVNVQGHSMSVAKECIEILKEARE